MNLREAFLTLALLPRRERDLLARIARGGIKINSRGCWDFLGGRQHGYGTIRRSAKNPGTQLIHRIVYEILVGTIGDGLVGRHSCDNPLCCNPDHIIPGTQLENVLDMGRRNRRNQVRGEAVGTSKLTADQVARIREEFSHGLDTKRALGVRFGVSEVMIGKIVRGTSWNTTT